LVSAVIEHSKWKINNAITRLEKMLSFDQLQNSELQFLPTISEGYARHPG